jgi:4-hydroxy-tetrahydrodipicolinate synthase
VRELKGYFVPLFTPFNRDGSVDEQAMRDNIAYLVQEGIHGITLTGSFGEFPLLSSEERIRLYKVAVDAAQGRCAVVAGTAHASTKETIRLSQAAQDVGVDGIMVIPPYYLLPSERDLAAHFRQVAESVSTQITIYNNPPRTGLNMSVSFLLELSHLENVVTIKQSSGFFFDLLELIRQVHGREGFHVTNGQEMWAFPALVMGAEALYGVSPLVLGHECIELYDHARKGRVEQGRDLQLKINKIRATLAQCKATPAACVRQLAKLKGLAAGFSRMPIVEPSEEDQVLLQKVIHELEVRAVAA